MAKRFTLDNSIVQDAKNWAEFKENIERDKSLRINLETYDEKLTFDGDGFEYLKAKMLESPCATVKIKVFDEACQRIDYKGLIVISESEFRECEVDVQIRNESFYYKLDANQSIKHNIRTKESPSGSSIVPTTRYVIKGTDDDVIQSDEDTDLREVFKVVDVLKHLTAYASDGELEFESEFLETNFPNLLITTGSRLRQKPFYKPLELSLKDAVEEISKVFNLWADVIYRDGKFIYKLEPYSEQFQNVVYPFDCLNLISFKVDEDGLFSKLELTSKAIDGTDVSDVNQEYLRFFKPNRVGYGDLDVPRDGDCVNSKEFDLNMKWIRDHNIIQDILINDAENYDNDIILIDHLEAPYVEPTTYPKDASKTEYYNERINNAKILEYYDDYLKEVGFVGLTNAPIYESAIEPYPSYSSPLLSMVSVDDQGVNNGGTVGSFLHSRLISDNQYFFDYLTASIQNSKRTIDGSTDENANTFRSHITPSQSTNYTFNARFVAELYTILDWRIVGEVYWIIRDTNGNEKLRELIFNGEVGDDPIDLDKLITKEVFLIQGVEYIIDEIEVNIKQKIGGNATSDDFRYTKKVGSFINIYKSIQSSAPRYFLAEVEGNLSKEQWEEIKENKKKKFCAKNCNFRLNGWIEELEFDQAKCFVKGVTKGKVNEVI